MSTSPEQPPRRNTSEELKRTNQVPPPPEIFEIGRGIEDDLSDDSIESISSRIGAWTEGAERMCGGSDSNDNRRDTISGELTDVQLDETRNKYDMSSANTANNKRNKYHSSGGSVASGTSVSSDRSHSSRRSSYSRSSVGKQKGSSSKRPSLRDVNRASVSLQRTKTGRMSRQRPRRYRPTSTALRNSVDAEDLDVPVMTTESMNIEQPVMDPEAQKFDIIASKYMWDMETEDETLSSITSRDNANKKRILTFCYIATFAAFIFGVLLAYTTFYSGRLPGSHTEPPLLSQLTDAPVAAKEDYDILTIDDIMPFLEKMCGPEALLDESAPQNNALQWLEHKDTFVSTSTNQLVQRFVLATFYFATKGTTAWDHETNWLTPKTECSWDGITCFDEQAYPDVAHLVSTITLSNYGISGVLPPEIGYLSHLRNLTLSSNDISGPIPSTIVKLTNLLSLNLESNQLDGALPQNMEQFKSIIEINLSNNKLNGPIPPDIGNLASLLSIKFNDNELSGIIPLEFVNLKQLKSLNLASNDIVGVIPKDIDNLSELIEFNVANNALFGQIPASFGNIQTLEVLNLSNNMFTNDIPMSLSKCDSLKELYLDGNAFVQGQTVPNEICLLGLELLTADCFDETYENYVQCDCCKCERR